MMKAPLTVVDIAIHAATAFGDRSITYRDGRNEALQSTTYAEFLCRVRQLADSLVNLGVKPGDRVASYAWNSIEHLELYFAVPAVGAVLHTVNIRLSPEDLFYVMDHAGDTVLFYDRSLLDTLPDELPPSIGTLVEIGEVTTPARGARRYESVVAEGDGEYEFDGTIDEQSAAVLCYTSGTTGRPKGVVYSHRSLCLYVLMANQPDAFGIRRSDTVLPLVPMFHANAWGLPYIAAMAGAQLVLPGPAPTSAIIARLIRESRVSISAAVPTVWQGLLDVAEPDDLRSIRELVAGGSAVPESLMRAYDDIFHIRLVQGWGMTETSPLAAMSRPIPDLDEVDNYAERSRQGHLLPFLHARLDKDAGGELQLRGPTVTGSYYRGTGQASFTDDGWLRTGDIAEIDRHHSIKLVDRTKDLVKSGGEWISSVELENAVLFHESVVEAAVVARPDPKWGERPYLYAVVREGDPVLPEEIKAFLSSRFPRWWVPDVVEFVTGIPKTSVGKIDKKKLRSLGS